MRLTLALYGTLVVFALALGFVYVLNLAPWYVDFFGPMAPAALMLTVVFVGLGLPLAIGGRLVLWLKAAGYKPFMARTIAGLALLVQLGMGAAGLRYMPLGLEDTVKERGPWLADFMSGADLVFEFDGGSSEPSLPPKWAEEAPDPPPLVGGSPDVEKRQLQALLDATKTAGGAARYLDDETAAAVGVRWLALGMTQWSDAWAHETSLQKRVDRLCETWKLPTDPAEWTDPSKLGDRVVPDGRRFLVQVDVLAAELSEAYGDARAMPSLVPYKDVAHGKAARPVRGEVLWLMHGGSFADIVGQPLDAERDYASLYDGDDPEAAVLFLVHPDPEFDGGHAAIKQAFLAVARADRGQRWRSPAYTRQWADSLTHSSAGRAAVRVIFMLSEGEGGDKTRDALLRRHHLPRDLDPAALPEDLTPKRGRKVLDAVIDTWLADYEAAWKTAPEAERDMAPDERKRRADAEALAWVRGVTVRDDGDTTVLVWKSGEAVREVPALYEDGAWRLDWP